MRRLLTKQKLIKELVEESSSSSRCETLHPLSISEIFKKYWKFDNGKYEASARNKEMPVQVDVPVWYETRTYQHGAYLQLLCVDEDRLTEQEKVL
jgi:hypothetical protein